MLKRLAFSGTIEWMRRRVVNIATIPSVDPGFVKASERSMAIAGALYPGRALCLEQSLALYYLLRCQGVMVKYCQGVQSHPFQAHAWLEYRGKVINDVTEHAVLFTRLPDQLP